ncbi:hypothetical protein PG994_000834 [Apiospora phragmitis]|uniref:NADP-dependent oxidoreductase domain-containing protein n=1 Tax=Apiospora phragmitis TaxID=2905665 RepID=A0ABR1X7D9_9PEZI
MSAQNIPTRRIGKNGTFVPALGLGLMGMSIQYGPAPSDEERFAVLDRAGDNEELLGKWFKRTGKRGQIFLATKFDFQKGSYTDIDTSAAFCKKACAESLRLLGTDYIDLYYMHRANPKTPIEETMRALLELKAANTLRRACKVGQVDCIQAEYSLFDLDIEGESGLKEACRDLGVSIVAYVPLGRGLLTGALTTKQSISGEGDYRASLDPRFSDENLDANVRVVRQLEAMAAQKGCSAAQLAVAWVWI